MVRLAIAVLLLPYSVYGLHAVEEIPPPLQIQPSSLTKASTMMISAMTSKQFTASPFNNSSPTALLNRISTQQLPKTNFSKTGALSSSKLNARKKMGSLPVSNAAAPEFEDRNEQDEGGKGEEEPDAHIGEAANAAPPADDVAAGEGVAKEDTEPMKGKDKDENQLGAMVEDAKGNVPAPLSPNRIQTHGSLDHVEDSSITTIIFVGGLLVFCLYMLHHNKKKILGLMFEGRAPSHSRRNVRYRRLSQRDDREPIKEDIC